jgi:hypothetical protein
MPVMFLSAGVVSMARMFGPKPADVLATLVARFKAEQGAAPDTLNITVTAGIPPIGEDEVTIWQGAFEGVIAGGGG